MRALRSPGGTVRPVVMSFMAAWLVGASWAPAVDPNTKWDGYRGIWFSIGQTNEYGPKYSGGLGTYTAKHRPLAIYASQVNKTFFVYGGVDDPTGTLLIMASYYDHATCQVPQPTVVLHKVGVSDPHDDPSLLIDRDGYLWVFVSGRGRARTGWIFRSTAPYSTDEFEWKRGGGGEDFFEITYPQPWYITAGVETPVFFHMFTRYTAGRELYWATSTDGVNWSDDGAPPDQGTKFAGFGGHYQSSAEWNGKIVTFFNYHPGGSVDRRTNLYYLQTTDLGQTWTTADGTPVPVPLTSPANGALVVDYQAQGRLMYVKDTNFDRYGNPLLLYITSGNYAAGPDSGPRFWTFARWDGEQWRFTEITQTDHNYDMGSLWVEGDLLRVIAPTEDGPQVWGTGGEVAVWTSTDMGATWHKDRDVTHDSPRNHGYVRRPVNARDPFYAFWADGNAFVKGESRLYFCNRTGNRVWQLPFHLDTDFARPTLVEDFGGSAGDTLWRSRFETMAAGPVAHGQSIEAVRNPVGAAGSTAGDSPLTYAAYGEAGVGVAPVPGVGSFAASLPDDRTVAIDSAVPSNAGNLVSALTFEGFFRTPHSTLITSPSFIGRRLVTQSRSEDNGSSRLAIGLHGATLPGGDGLFDYEGFNYTGTALEGQNGGIGFAGPWTNAAAFAHLSNDGVSLDSDIFPFTPVGSRISGTGGTAARPLSRPINLSSEGQVTYLSALMLKTSTAAATGDNLEIGLSTGATTSSTIRIGMTSPDQFFLTNSSNPAGMVVAGTPYFVVVKMVSHSSTPDELFMNVYAPGDTVPTTEPGSWLLTHSLSSSAMLSHLRLTIGSSLNKGEIDEIRVGNTYAAVTDPNAPIATGGGQANVLSVFWFDTDENNHLESGTTPIQADRWYHFALVYNGADIKWYLDGNLEGQVTGANLFTAGSAVVSIGNNRLGMDDRGFYGLLDEVRISDQALAPGSFLLNGGSCESSCGAGGPSVLWCSGFEAEPEAPVVHEQPEPGVCGGIENLHGRAGTAVGVSSLTYVAYDQPGIGSAPHVEAGAFAMSLPDDRSVAIDSHLPSNAGNLNNALTFEGFFNSAEAGPIVSPDGIGRRLITQKRDTDTDTRLAVGLHASGGSNVLSLLWKRSDGATQVIPGVTPIQAGSWHHFALVYDGADIRWYLNGSPEGAVLGADLIAAGSASIVLGNRGSGGASDRGFYGLIDEIRIVDAALEPSGFLIGAGEPGLENPCLPSCPWPFADVDEDGDVDQVDFAGLQACLTGEGVFGLSDPARCYCFDRDGDERIDAMDLEAFLDCATGPEVPWSSDAMPACVP